MADGNNFDIALTCPICLDIASYDNAVETTCCHQLYCSTCIGNVRPCPSCRADDFQTTPSYFARRLIGNTIVQCPNEGCTVKISRSDLKQHTTGSCAYVLITCPDPQCQGFKCQKDQFIKHLTKTHQKLIIDNFSKLWEKDVDVRRGVIIHSAETPQVRVNAPAASDNNVFDERLEKTKNKFGRYARLGSTGKFYCGGVLDGSRCNCCDGHCGPTSGCNCSGCMLLDVQKRQLPRGWLVNRDGASARRSRVDTTKFYCGRRVMVNDPRTDGYCGPTDGEQCEACKKLNEQEHRRYNQVWGN